MVALIGPGQPDPELGVEVAGTAERAAGQERGLQILVGPLDQPLGLRIRGRHRITLIPKRPAEGLHRLGQLRTPGPPRPDRRLVVPDQRPRRRAPPREQRPVPGQQVRALPRRDHPRGHHPRVARDHHQHRRRPRPAPPPAAPASAGTTDRTARARPGRYSVRDAGSAGRYSGRSSRTRSLSTVNDRVQPIRSAITVAGIVGHASSSSRTCGSTSSTIEPFAKR